MNTEWVINTRPLTLQESTSDIILRHGLKPLNLPLMDIDFLSFNGEDLKSAGNQAVLVFTSQFAVQGFFNQDVAEMSFPLIAVGDKTAAALSRHSSDPVMVPEMQNSEGVIELLEDLPDWDHLIVIGGRGGRQAMQRYVQAKELKFTKLETYERIPLNLNSDQKRQLRALSSACFLVTSVTTLEQLQIQFRGVDRDLIAPFKMLCSSARIAQAAESMGFDNILNVNSSNLDEMLNALK